MSLALRRTIVSSDVESTASRFTGRGLLLNDMRQLVGDELLAVWTRRRILPLRERDVGTHGVRQRIDCTCGLCGLRVRVDAHVAEVASESSFHLGAHARVERIA
jgi:hypothetical protein